VCQFSVILFLNICFVLVGYSKLCVCVCMHARACVCVRAWVHACMHAPSTGLLHALSISVSLFFIFVAATTIYRGAAKSLS
jgi:hypothetical protein